VLASYVISSTTGGLYGTDLYRCLCKPVAFDAVRVVLRSPETVWCTLVAGSLGHRVARSIDGVKFRRELVDCRAELQRKDCHPVTIVTSPVDATRDYLLV
jgi:hypothetical protein